MKDETIIDSDEKLAKALAIVKKGKSYLAVAKRKQGEHWFSECGRLHDTDAREIMHEMASLFAEKLANMDNVGYWSAEEIADKREPVPEYVDIPGFYQRNAGELLLSNAEEKAGIWGYEYDMTETRVIFTRTT